MKTTIIDALMGQGKTTYCIDEIKRNPNRKYVVITPFLDEVGRIQQEVGKVLVEGDVATNNTTFHTTKDTIRKVEVVDIEGKVVNRPWRLNEPKHKGQGKLDSFKELLEKGESIVTTHALMSLFDYEVQDLLSVHDYHLILDEVIDVVSEYIWSSKSDKETFFNYFGSVGDDGYLIWDTKKHNPATYDGRFKDLLTLCINKNLMVIDDSNKVMMWELPVSIFSVFESVTLLTFMFDGSYQKTYFDAFKVKYEYKSIKNGELVDYEDVSADVRARLKTLINIEESPTLNKIGDPHYALTSSWYKRNVGTTSKETVYSKKLKDNTYNFFKNRVTNPATKNLWSTLSNYRTKLKGSGYSKAFLSFNARATNNYRDRVSLAYLVNIYPHTSITSYFNESGLKLNEQAFALALLLQWIWRSQIREGLPINLYLPSRRMRGLLVEFLN